ncbi:MBL fold metallo-hydrolase [Georgenia faecalis]|uniref:MBL fold metallo-hydrolase n=1 Tax=Georgenia faecalis TaxID=2483799 RepID=UPI000FD8ED41|nr:MBL fold metallo-hydrolase [Georgenia faecalis]
MLTTVAEGVHRLEHARVNVVLVEDDDGLTIVDAGLPGVWNPLGRTIRELGYRPRDVQALLLTHAHFDHVGVAARLQRELAVPVWAHDEEAFLAAHPYRYVHERARGIYPLRYPAAIPVLARMTAAGALWVKGVRGIEPFVDGQTVDVPGRPTVVFTPGHTFGHCALHLPDRDVVITGDALVTLDPYTGHSGPQIVSGAATADSVEALASLERIADTGASVLIPGHGDTWHDGARAAVTIAQQRGAS